MFQKRSLAALGAAVFIAGVVLAADEKGEGPGKDNGAKAAVPTLTFEAKDGNKIVGTSALDAFTVKTKYGDLVVPIREIRTVRMGKGSDPDLQKKIMDLVAQLGHKDLEKRDDATETLRKMGLDVLPELKKAAGGSEDLEIKERARILVEGIEAAREDEEGPAPIGEKDEVATDEFTIQGFLDIREIEVTTKYGKLNVKKSNILALSVSVGEGAVEAEEPGDPAKISENEDSAIASLRTLVTSEEQYKTTDGAGLYADLKTLNLAVPPFIDSVLSSGKKKGYKIKGGFDAGTNFTFSAVPEKKGKTGKRYFFVDSSGVIRFNDKGPATSGSAPIE